MKNILLLTLIVIGLSEPLTTELLESKMTSVLNSPFVNLMVVYDTANEKGPLLQQAIEQIGKKKQGYFKIVLFDCNTDDEGVIQAFPYCGKEIRQKLPAIIFTEPPINFINIQTKTKNEGKNHQYTGNLLEKSLYDFAVKFMNLYSINLRSSGDWRKFKQSHPQTPKILYFTDKQKISPFFKSLTAHFRNTIAFGHIYHNSSLCKQLGVTTFPTLLLNGIQKIELTSNLLQMVQILKVYQGKPTDIYIQQFENLISELSSSNFNVKILQNPNHILIHVPGDDGKPHPQWKKCQQNFKRMIEYYDGSQIQDKLSIKNRPAIIYYPKSLAKKELKKTIFYSNNNFRNIYDEVQGLIDDFSVTLSNERDFGQLTSISLAEGRFVVMLFHKEQISLSYRVLSNHDKFKDVLVFYRMKNPPEQIVNQYKIKKLPSLFVMVQDKQNNTQSKEDAENDQQGKRGMNLKIASFTGKFNYDQLQAFLNHFVAKTQQIKQPQSSNSKQIIEIKNKKTFNKFCAENCYLLLLDQSQEKKATNLEHINNLKKGSSHIFSNIGYIDAKCHSELISKLQIYADDLPAFVHINSNFLKYSRLIGRIEEKSIQQFFARIKTNKVIWRQYQNLQFKDLNCAQEHKRLKQLQTSSFTMSAQEAQILQEIKQQQLKKKEASGAEGAQKKKRKKRRPKQQDSQL